MNKIKGIYCSSAVMMTTLFAILFFQSLLSFASDQTGTLTQLQGNVKIFSNPSKTPPQEQEGSRVLFEGEYFTVREAKTGDVVENGNIVRTAPGAKARVVYENGDQINVGAGTAYRISWEKGNEKGGETKVNLAYGKLRGIIEKGGPRSHLQIKTRTAVMGVRGTDFFIAQGGADETTEVSIIRGTVEVTPKTPKAKPIEVKAGLSATIAPEPPVAKRTTASENTPPPVSAKVELRKTTQEEFAGIQKSSVIAPQTSKAPVSTEAQKKIEQLEKQASVTTLKDIQIHDKKLYAALEKQGVKSVDDVNQAAIHELAKEAPKAPAAHKPYKSELENIEDGAYERYFKSVD